MRVVYYTHPAFLDAALCFVREMSARAELHLLLELSPESWRTSLLDVERMHLPPGLMPADPVLGPVFPEGVRLYWQKTASFNVVVHNCPRSIHPSTWAAGRNAARHIRNIAPDVVHFDDVSLRSAGVVKQLRGIPIVLSIHDPIPHSGDYRWRREWARRITFGLARRFIIHNKAQKFGFCRRYHVKDQNVDVVPLGVYDIYREWSPQDNQQEPATVLFFGRLGPYKGLERLFGAARTTAEQIAGVRFIVAGKPVPGYQLPPPPDLPNGGRIEVVSEYVSNLRLTELFRRATVVACPYTDATQSGVILTSYAFRKPVVATKVGGMPEYVQEGVTGVLVSAPTEDGIADALVAVLKDSRRGQKGPKAIDFEIPACLRWDDIANRTLEVYRRVLGKNVHAMDPQVVAC